jgi:hypothetical protein
MAMLGLIGGPVLAAGFVGVLFGVFEAGSVARDRDRPRVLLGAVAR